MIAFEIYKNGTLIRLFPTLTEAVEYVKFCKFCKIKSKKYSKFNYYIVKFMLMFI